MIDKRYAKMAVGPVPCFVKDPDGTTRKVMNVSSIEDLIGSFIADGDMQEDDRYREMYMLYKAQTRRDNTTRVAHMNKRWQDDYAAGWLNRYTESLYELDNSAEIQFHPMIANYTPLTGAVYQTPDNTFCRIEYDSSVDMYVPRQFFTKNPTINVDTA